jgi:alkanesulfonate monooxygenase SsuD/methylene tetrahydromethanopterin reductase-like flavin-dependent oxidoreductase (luciferase family)
MTVSTDRSVTTAAELGLRACYWQPPPLRIRERMEIYARVRSAREGRQFRLGEDQAVMRSTYVASSMEEARREAEAGIMSAFIFNDPFRGRQVFTNPGETLGPEVGLDWDFLEPRTLLVGSPENVVERVQELQEVCHLDYLLVEFSHMGIPLSKTLRNLETFATKVMPRFAGDS